MRDLAGSLRLSQESTIILAINVNLKSCVVLTITVRCPYGDVRCCCDVFTGYGLKIFQTCHCAELNKIVEATMPVNPYDDRKVSLRRPHGNGDLDIVRASYTGRKANVTEALVLVQPRKTRT